MSERTFEKLNETTIRMVKLAPVAFDYTRDGLLKQKEEILAQLEEIDLLIAKCEELKIVDK